MLGLFFMGIVFSVAVMAFLLHIRKYDEDHTED
jgi:hypothetical protein